MKYKEIIVKYVVVALALSVSVPLGAMHVTKRVAKEVSKSIPLALKEISEAFQQEISARDSVLQKKILIETSKDLNEVAEARTSLRVNLLPALIVAAAHTKNVSYGRSVYVSSLEYDGQIVAEEYILEFAPYAYESSFKYFNAYRAYTAFLRHLSKNPEILEITLLK